MLLVLSPWNDPIPLTRVWCLWEIYCAVDLNVHFDIHVPHDQRASFRKNLLQDWDTITNILTTVNLQRADSRYKEDKEQIVAAVERTVGMHQLDVRLKEYFRGWCFRELERAVEELHGREDKVAADGWRSLGVACLMAGQHTRALEHLHKARQWYEREYETGSTGTAYVYNDLGRVHSDMGEHELAKQQYGKALVIREKVLGSDHPDTASTYNNLGNVHLDLGE